MTERLAPLQAVVGTAGHVDHGKSALVTALSGSDPDRLPEEKRRGMTIELGFAFMQGEEGPGPRIDIAFIDCPGHERFVHHMVAGAGSMEGCLLVIAANEGPCAQTREHLEILKLLDLRWGLVVLSKRDLVDEAGLAATREAVAGLVQGTVFAVQPPLAVSAHRGDGLPELRTWLLERAVEQRRRAAGNHVRLPVDRVFSVAGHGTVVTGTLLSGELRVGDALELFPGGLLRIRSLQVNRLAVDRAVAGQRTAVNLAGIERDAVHRGAWLASPGTLRPTRNVDVRLQALSLSVKHRCEVDIHHGTTSVSGRVHLIQSDSIDGGEHHAQLRLDADLWLRPGDRLILRRPSPPANLAGAVVIDADPPHHKRFSHQAAAWYESRDRRDGISPDTLLAWIVGRTTPPSEAEAAAWAGGPAPLSQTISSLGEQVIWRQVGALRLLWSRAGWDELERRILDGIADRLRSHSERCWLTATALRTELAPDLPEMAWQDRLDAIDRLLRREGRVTRPELIGPLPPRLQAAAQSLWKAYHQAGLEPPYDHPCWGAQPDPQLAAIAHAALVERGWLLRLNDRQHLHRHHAELLVAGARAAMAEGDLDVPTMKQRFSLSRKYSIPYLEWLDAMGITRRQGDRRIPGPHATLPIPALGPALHP